MWILFGILSSFLLGGYDVSKKAALNNNAVLPVLASATMVSWCAISLAAILSQLGAAAGLVSHYRVLPMDSNGHLLMFVKALLVTISWVSGYFAMKHLPVSIVSPIRSSAPLWTTVGALFIFREFPSLLQWFGFCIILVSYMLFSRVGSREGIQFHRNKWIVLVGVATISGAASALFDRFLIYSRQMPPTSVQFWHMAYMAFLQCMVVVTLWFPNRKNTTPFTWRWSIVLIGVVLALSDFFYLRALTSPEAYIGILSIIRRTSVIYAFLLGGILFHEKNRRKKAVPLVGIIIGLVLLMIESQA